MPRTVAERRTLFLIKAPKVTGQDHFDQIMQSFPEELRAEIYEEVKPLLSKPFVYSATTEAGS